MRLTKLLLLSWMIIGLLFYQIKLTRAFSGSGEGSSDSPYQITTCSQLQEIDDDLDGDYLLMNDVDCDGVDFVPMGDITTNLFVGTLDGGGHKVTNLEIDPVTDLSYVGIFQKMGSGGLITNIGIESGSIKAWEGGVAIGSFAAQASGGTISNSYSKATLDGSLSGFISPNMGGLVGTGQNITISNSYYIGDIINGSVNPQSTGGIVGVLTSGSVTNSYTAGTLYSGSKMGGIAGNLQSSSTITNSFTTMTRTITGFSASWGMVGEITSGSISNGYWNDPDDSFFAACYAGGNTGCTKIVKNIPYFYTITNAPMSSWDFEDTWSDENNGDDYPVLYWESNEITPSPTPTPTPSPSSSVSNTEQAYHPPYSIDPPSCSDSNPNAVPDLFKVDAAGTYVNLYFSTIGGTTGYNVTYGLTPEANQYGDLFGYSGNAWTYGRTIGGLNPNTTYYFKVQGINGCNGGEWSKVFSVKTKGRFSNITQWFANLSK